MAAPRRWSGRSYARPQPAGGQSPDSGRREADAQGQSLYLRSLRSWAPGQWTDNRLEQSRHQLGAVHVAIKVLSDMAASCEVRVVRHRDGSAMSDGSGDAEPVERSHPLARLMRRPNSKETGGQLRRRLVQQLCLTGTALAWHLRDGNGVPAEAWCIPTGTWQPMLRSGEYPEGAYRVLPYFSYGPFAAMPGLMRPGGVVIPADEVLRVDFPHPLVQYDSYSPLTAVGLQIEALEAVDRSRSYMMRQGINPSGVVELDPQANMPDQDELDRLKEEFAAKYGGPENTGRVAVMSPGAKLSPWSRSSTDMGFEQAWSQLVDFVLSAFGTTKILAFMAEASSYAALYASLKQFNVLSMSPLLQLLADCVNCQLVWPHWGDDHSVEFIPAAIDDKDQRRQNLSLAVSVGALTYDELRAGLDMDPVDGDWGKERAWTGQAAAQMQKAEAAAAQAGAPDAPGGDSAASGSLESLLAGLDASDTQDAGLAASTPDPGGLGQGSLPPRLKSYLANGTSRNGH